MSKLVQITPFVVTHDLDGSVAFFTQSLGFHCGFREDDYAYLHRAGGALRVVEVAPDCEIGEQMIYFDCEDVDAFFDRLKPQLDLLPEGRVRAPFDQPYNQREFHVKDPDNCLLLFGSEIPPSP